MKRTMSARWAAALALTVACGGSGGTNPPPPPPPGNVTLAKAANSGDGQSAPISSALPSPLRVLATQGGTPAAGRTVSWSVTPAGSANPASSQTGADGIATTTITLPGIGTQVTISAASVGATGSPLTFTADATGAGTAVTVQVGNAFFAPQFFRLKQGGTVTFTWTAGSVGHSVQPVAPNSIPASANPAPPGLHNAPYTFNATFPDVGIFKFHCSAHGAPDSGMHGTVTVIP
jgi:plastocyanin